MLDSHGLHYESLGTGTPILCLHGWSLDLGVMKACLEPALANRPGWERVYVDLPGMGASSAEPMVQTTDDVVSRLLTFADEVIGNNEFLLCGESYGAYLARAILRQRAEKVAGMLLFCPIVLPDKARRTLPDPATILADRDLLASLSATDAQTFASMATVQDAPRWERFRDEILPALARADHAVLDRIREQGYGCSYDVDDLTHPFTKPVAILTGRQDASVGYADAWRLSERYPRATFTTLDRAGHSLQIEQADLFCAFVLEWLDRVAAERR